MEIGNWECKCNFYFQKGKNNNPVFGVFVVILVGVSSDISYDFGVGIRVRFNYWFECFFDIIIMKNTVSFIKDKSINHIASYAS